MSEQSVHSLKPNHFL